MSIRITFATLAAALLGACASLPPVPGRPASFAYTDTRDTTLGRVSAENTTLHPGLSGVLPLDSGLDAYVARAVLAGLAERSIDVQYYLFHSDTTGNFLAHKLLEAADRGVRVRILVDDMGIDGRDRDLAAMDLHPNVEVRVFNPFSRSVPRWIQFITGLGTRTRRMHNKSFTVDGQVTILGGRNIGDEYFDADPALQFGDLDVLAIGPVVREVSTAFDLYWNSDLAHPAEDLVDENLDDQTVAELRASLAAFAQEQRGTPYARALENSRLARAIRENTIRLYWGEATTVYDRPEKVLAGTDRKDLHLGPQLRPYFEATRSELIIFSPYFVPGSAGVRFLREIEQKGVRVRILTNSLASTDVGVVHAGYSKYRQALLRDGAELYEVDRHLTRTERKEKKKEKNIGSKASLHAKTFIFDRETVFIGSLNLDPRSLVQNTEIGVVLHVPELAAEMAQAFARHVSHAAFRVELYEHPTGGPALRWVKGDRVFYNEPYVGFWRSLGVQLMSLLPIESQI